MFSKHMDLASSRSLLMSFCGTGRRYFEVI